MIFYRYLYLLSMILFSGLIASAAEEYHTFTNSNGVTIKAKPLRMQGDRVEIEREDGQTFVVDPAIFTSEDREFLAQWRKERAIDKGAIEVAAKSATTRKVKEDNGAVEYKIFKGYYKVSVSNTSEMTFKDLKAEYRFFVFENEIAADKRSDGKLKRYKGDTKITSLAPYGNFEFETDKAEMKESKLASGWYYVGGGKDKSEDELEGIWVRIYKDEDIVGEYAYPSTLPEKEKW